MFTLQDGRECLYQWDLDRKVIVDDPTISEVHFCNKTDECSLVVETYSSDGVLVANIPNILLQTDFPIRVYAYCADGYTKVENIFKVKSRTRPNDYVYTETQTKTWTELAQKADDTLHTAQVAINSIDDYKEDIEAELKDVDAELAEYQERIRLLELANEGHTYAFTTVEEMAVKHDVPASALPYARLDSIGGNTKKCTNLLPMIPNTDWGIGTDGYDTSCDYHVWVDEDGYLTIDSEGRDTGISSILELPESLFKNIPKGATVSTYVRYVSGYADGGWAYDYGAPYIHLPIFEFNMQGVAMTEGATYTETFTYKGNSMHMQVVGCFSNLKLAITVVEGSTPIDNPAYYEGFKSAKVTAVKSYGKNLVPPTIYDINNWTIDTTWAKFTLPSVLFDGDYTLTVKKNPNIDWSDAIVSIGISKDGGASWVRPDGWVDGYLITSNTYKIPVTFSLKKGDKIRLAVYPTTQDTIDKIIDIQFEQGNKATEYAPYSAEPIDTYIVPEEVQAIDGYGMGIKSAYNFVDFASKQFSKRVKEIVLTGRETMFSYEYQGLNGVSLTVLDGKYVRAKGVCSHGNVVTNGNAVSGNMWIGVNNSNVYWLGIMDLLGFAPTHLTNFRAYLAEQYANGTPVRIIYDSADDTNEPITDEIPDTVYLKVEGNGYIVAENDEGIEAPLTITYQVKL